MVIWLSLQIHVGIISNVINTTGVNVIAPTFHGLAPILSWFWYNLSKRKKGGIECEKRRDTGSSVLKNFDLPLNHDTCNKKYF